jgi:hypothetical protein
MSPVKGKLTDEEAARFNDAYQEFLNSRYGRGGTKQMIQKDVTEQLIYTGSIRDLAEIALLLAGDEKISDLKNIHEYKRLQQTRFLMALFGSRGQIRTMVEACYQSLIMEEVKKLLRDGNERRSQPGETDLKNG